MDAHQWKLAACLWASTMLAALHSCRAEMSSPAASTKCVADLKVAGAEQAETAPFAQCSQIADED